MCRSIPAGLDGPLFSFKTRSAAPVEYVNPIININNIYFLSVTQAEEREHEKTNFHWN